MFAKLWNIPYILLIYLFIFQLEFSNFRSLLEVCVNCLVINLIYFLLGSKESHFTVSNLRPFTVYSFRDLLTITIQNLKIGIITAVLILLPDKNNKALSRYMLKMNINKL